jgi:hypothetical protein
MNEYNFFTELLNHIPSWLISSLVVLIVIKKYFCEDFVKVIIRLVAKSNARKDRIDAEQDKRLEKMEKTIEKILDHLTK